MRTAVGQLAELPWLDWSWGAAPASPSWHSPRPTPRYLPRSAPSTCAASCCGPPSGPRSPASLLARTTALRPRRRLSCALICPPRRRAVAPAEAPHEWLLAAGREGVRLIERSHHKDAAPPALPREFPRPACLNMRRPGIDQWESRRTAGRNQSPAHRRSRRHPVDAENNGNLLSRPHAPARMEIR